MPLFYLRNEFFFSLELRRHTETTLHYGHLHDNKCKKIIGPDFLSQQIHCGNGAFFLSSLEEFVSRTVRAIALCTPTVHRFTRNMHAHMRTDDFLFYFFYQEEKLSSPRKRIW